MLPELTADCPRCEALKSTFDVSGENFLGVTAHGWVTSHEVFGVCRACGRSTIFVLRLKDYEASHDAREPRFWQRQISFNRHFEVRGYVSLKDRDPRPSPDALPDDVAKAYAEGSRCMAAGCPNAAAAMFRLALDLATEPLLPPEDEPEPARRIRRDLGLRLPWLFDSGRLPVDLRALSDCVREDGNDGAHRGNISDEDAEDLQDFCFVLLERLFTERARLAAAEDRRKSRRAEARKQ